LKKSKHSVETKDLSISWGEVNVLNQLNFKLNDGEKLAIVGPSGSGKSTILKILAGLILPTKGELRIFGEKQKYLKKTKKLKLGYLHLTQYLKCFFLKILKIIEFVT